MLRVLVIGSPGSGKSTLATAVAQRMGLPLVHLDQHYWRPGWVEPDKETWARQVEALAAGERWVMDGNYGGTLAPRLARADTVVWLDFATWVCLARIVRRAARHRGRVRPDMADGCPERLRGEFIAHVLRFRRASRRRIVDKLARFTGPLIHLRRPREAARFLSALDLLEAGRRRRRR
jgi:adenylate kinase family enzyme